MRDPQAPHRGMRRSIVPPTPEELPELLRRLSAQLGMGQPEIHLGGRQSPHYLLAKD